MSKEMIVIVAAAISALVSSAACLVTYYFTRKNTLEKTRSAQSEADILATSKQREVFAQKRLESYLDFWAKTAPLSSEYLRRMTPDEAKSIYNTLLAEYEQNGFYLGTKTGRAFQELRCVLRMLSRDEGSKDILDQVWKAKYQFRWSMKQDLMIVNEPAEPLEMGWWETQRD